MNEIIRQYMREIEQALLGVAERLAVFAESAFGIPNGFRLERERKERQRMECKLRNHVMRVNAGNRRRQKRSNPDTHRV